MFKLTPERKEKIRSWAITIIFIIAGFVMVASVGLCSSSQTCMTPTQPTFPSISCLIETSFPIGLLAILIAFALSFALEYIFK